MLAAFITGLNGPLAPYLQDDLGLSRAQIGLLTSARFVATVGVAVPAGYIVGSIGVRRSLMVSMLGFVLTAALFAIVRGDYQAYVVFFLMGMAFAIVNPSTTKAIMDYFPMRGRATMMALKQMGVPLGGVLAALAFPLLASSWGWRWSVGAASLAAAVTLGLIGVLLKPSMAAIPDATAEATPAGHPSRTARSFLADFYSLFRERDLVITAILQGAFMTAQTNVTAYLVLYLTEEMGFHIVLAGGISAAAQVSGTMARLLWGMASDYWLGGRVNTLRLIGFTMTAGLFVVGWTGSGTPSWLVWLAAVLVGAGALGWAGAVTLLRAELVGRERAAMATGFGMTIGSWGALAGPPLFGLLVDLTGMYRYAWWATALITLLATFALWQVREPSLDKSSRLEPVSRLSSTTSSH